MTPDQAAWTIVITGTWNVAIFSPQWVGRIFKDLFEVEGIEVVFVFGPEGPGCRYSGAGISVHPGCTGLIIALSNTHEETLRNAEKIARRILADLPHTPVTGFGINFGFVEEHIPRKLRSLFELEDQAALEAKDYVMRVTQIERRLEISGGILNTRLMRHHESDQLRIGLNFHHGIVDSEEMVTLLENRVTWCETYARELLSSVYGLEWKGEQ